MSYAQCAVFVRSIRLLAIVFAAVLLCISAPAQAKRHVHRTTKRVAKKAPNEATKKMRAKKPSTGSTAAKPAAPAADDATTTGEAGRGDDDVVVDEEEEEEVSFADEDGDLGGEEVNRADLDDGFFMPEYAESPWTLAFPLLCVLILMWNVGWVAVPRQGSIKTWPDGVHARRRPKTDEGGKKRRTTRG